MQDDILLLHRGSEITMTTAQVLGAKLRKKMTKTKKRTRYCIQVPTGAIDRIAKQCKCSSVYVSRALRYNSETAPSEIKIRDIARQQYGGKEVKVVYSV
jgi:hypothetical protein